MNLTFLMAQSIFSSKIFQNYLAFILANKSIKYFSGTARINLQRPNGMSEESTKNKIKSDSNFAPNFVNHHLLPDINFNGHCLINYVSIPKKE